MTDHDTGEWLRPYAVEAASIEDFMARYYKKDRYTGSYNYRLDDGRMYSDVLLASHRQNAERDGYDWISHHDSATGEIVAWFAPQKEKTP